LRDKQMPVAEDGTHGWLSRNEVDDAWGRQLAVERSSAAADRRGANARPPGALREVRAWRGRCGGRAALEDGALQETAVSWR